MVAGEPGEGGVFDCDVAGVLLVDLDCDLVGLLCEFEKLPDEPFKELIVSWLTGCRSAPLDIDLRKSFLMELEAVR